MQDKCICVHSHLLNFLHTLLDSNHNINFVRIKLSCSIVVVAMFFLNCKVTILRLTKFYYLHNLEEYLLLKILSMLLCKISQY